MSEQIEECEECGCQYDTNAYTQCPQCEEELGNSCPVCGRDFNAYSHRNCGDSGGPY